MAQRTSRKSGKDPGPLSDTRGKQLVIVESPAKARTINKYLGPEFLVMASVGHVRDLPDRNPKGINDPVPGVDLEHGFRPNYEIIKEKARTIKELRKAAKQASGIWLATDLDREGEAIAWHLTEALGVKPADGKRVVFNAITKKEIEKAFQRPRKINMDKVNAQQARRILDRIVGYQVSPLLWRKVAGGLSAGRVQSVAVRLLVDREREIESFVPEEYWRLIGYFTVHVEQAAGISNLWRQWLSQAPARGPERKSNGWTLQEKNRWLADHGSFAAELVELDGKKLETKDGAAILDAAKRAGFELDERIETEDPKAKGPAKRRLQLRGHVARPLPWRIRSVEIKRVRSKPPAPFITSTLQQAAANQLDFAAQTTMRIAQMLYEGVTIKGMGSVGLITYMRTDSTHLAGEAINMARAFIASNYGDKYLPKKPHIYSSSNQSAQEAHEAIRPTDVNLTPESIRSSLDERQYKLYKLIWERFVACQMAEALWDSTTVLISAQEGGGEIVFRASGRVLVFDGFYRLSGIPNTSGEAELPPLAKDQPLASIHLDPLQNFTSPPPRYTEASLVKKLEAEGIGRPSTYAQIIQVILNRKYAEKVKNRFYATDLGKVVTDKLIEAFPEIMEIGYTREMEQKLDDIEEKHADWIEMLHRFYGPFKQSLEHAYESLEHAKAETEPAPHICPECGGGTVYRFGRSGRFLSCSRYPDCKFASPIDRDGNPVEFVQTDIACPKCSQPMVLRKGRYGPFLSCSRYPDCDGIVNLDRKGSVVPPKTPPLLTDLPCPKCHAPMNLRRGAKGPWLSCSKFPKCRGRLSWTALEDQVKDKWIMALEDHERKNPLAVIRRVDGTPAGSNYKPRPLVSAEDDTGE
ncbi:MAG: type I DNA topoisomerase [Deltaproteobacteria bacterium]|nr:type I DNA topoisomerase [Deltaproteobacteria bacterium]